MPFGDGKKSLLEYEIKIAKPEVIIFITGPTYIKSMAAAFSINPEQLNSFKPTMKNPCQRIDGVLEMPVPIYWTYHPSFLNRKNGFFDQCFDEFITVI